MAQHYEVTTDKEATPMVRVLASTLRLALQRPETQKLLSGLDGSFTVKSINGAQAATYTFDGNQVSLKAGKSKAAKVMIEADLDDPSAKPKITGLLRHPIAAMRFGELLSLPLPNWADSAKRFWAATYDLPNMPEKLIITNKDEDRSLTFGEGIETVELIGTTNILEPLFAGHSILSLDVMTGKLQYRGSLEHLTGMSNACQKLLMGELDG